MNQLSGVRVLDTGRLMPSAVATAELAKLGATVAKVELPPFGDYLRVTEPFIRGRGDMHLELNRNKQSLALRFDQPRGRDVLLRLVKKSDVFVELSRPVAMERLGLDYEALSQINPRLIYCSFSGYGQTGEYAPLAAHGLSADAAGGLLHLDEVAGEVELPEPYVSVGPRASGLYGAIAILGALYETRVSGRGQRLDVSQADSAMAWNFRDFSLLTNTGTGTPSYRALGPRYEAYECADGHRVLFAATEPKLWRAFCAAADRRDLIDYSVDVVVEYGENKEVRAELRRLFRQRKRQAWIALAVEHGLPIAPILNTKELPHNRHFRERNMVSQERHPLGGDVILTGHPVKYEREMVAYVPAPELGEHSEVVLRDYGFKTSEISSLIADGVVWGPKDAG